MAEDTVTILPYQERFIPSFKEFANRVWPNRPRKTDDTYLRWKFQGPASGPMPNLHLAVLNDEIVVGQLGVVPAKLRLGEAIHDTQWIGNFMVDETRRGLGIGKKLVGATCANGKLTLGCNPTESSIAVHEKMGFSHLLGPHTFFLPIDPKQLVEWKLPSRFSFLKSGISLASRPYFAWLARDLHLRKASVKVQEVSLQDEGLLAAMSEREKAIRDPHIIHDAEFLAWRSTIIPPFENPLIALKTDAGSYALVAITKHMSSIYDWYSVSDEELHAMIREVYKMAQANGSHTIQIYANTDAEYQVLRSLGFLAARTRVDVICYPIPEFIPQYKNFSFQIYDSDGGI